MADEDEGEDGSKRKGGEKQSEQRERGNKNPSFEEKFKLMSCCHEYVVKLCIKIKTKYHA